MTINEKIKREIEARGWSYYKLAKIMKVDPATVKSWFKEVPTTPSYSLVEAAAKALDMEMRDLVADDKEADPQTKKMKELWRRLGTKEKDCVLTVMTTIVEHR